MVYESVTFEIPQNRPFYFTNFVTTVDGKVRVTNEQGEKYWPIGSKTDYQTLVELRAYADVLIHGKNTAMSHRTVDSLGKSEFKKLRTQFGKTNDILYVVMSDHPDEKLHEQLKNPNDVKHHIVGSDVRKLNDELFAKGHKVVLVEGGPHVLGDFLKEDLLDEVFLTIAPKIFGNEKNSTISMVEGVLFSPEKIKQLEVISAKPVENEVFLRYKVNH